MADEPAHLPEPAYYAVIFASQRSDGDAGYAAISDAMEALARQQPGFLGIESARSPDGFGLTESYFETEVAISARRGNAAHLAAQKFGKERWQGGLARRVGMSDIRSLSGRLKAPIMVQRADS